MLLRIAQGLAVEMFEDQDTTINAVLIALFVITVGAWGFVDARRDAARCSDPDGRTDLTMIWLLAGIVAGIASGLASWVVGLFYDGLLVSGILTEVTTTAAFVALLVFIPAITGVFVGRTLVDRKAPAPTPRVVNDVFAAVQDDA